MMRGLQIVVAAFAGFVIYWIVTTDSGEAAVGAVIGALTATVLQLARKHESRRSRQRDDNDRARRSP